jgi:SAM-dependent methyltransferase
MSLNWINTSLLSFNHLLLLERVQLSWFPGWLPEPALALALKANPVVEWYLRHKCPEIIPWLDKVCSIVVDSGDAKAIYAAEQTILQSIEDLLIYAIDPTIYDTQPFLGWEDHELTDLVDFTGKIVLDIGSGTGKLAFIAAQKAAVVYPVEPVGNLRVFLREKASRLCNKHVYPVDGLITQIPFADGFADITLCGHVFGDKPAVELAELERVTRPGGMVILCPGTSMTENTAHEVLAAHRYQWAIFEEPADGPKRKYWKVK